MSFAFRTQQTDLPDRSQSVASAAPLKDVPRVPSGFRIVPAQTGDHFAIHRFLVSIFHGPAEREFQATLDEPLYEPPDQLLAKRGDTIVGHLFVKKRVLQLGGVHVATGQICDLAVWPEFRGRGLGGALLKTAEQRLAHEGVCLATARAQLPEFFRAHGWGTFTRFCLSLANPRSLLSELTPTVKKTVTLAADQPLMLQIRLWRQIELEALRSLHRESTGQRFGVWQRSEAVWRWLIVRRAFERIYVATIDDDSEDLTTGSNVVAYAVLRDSQVLELVTRDGNVTFSRQLLARVCADAIERGSNELTLHAPPDDPAHEWFEAAGSPPKHPAAVHQHELLAKLLDPGKMLEQLTPLWNSRLSGVWHLGFRLEQQQLLFEHDDNGLQVLRDKAARNFIELSTPTLLNLICGQVDVAEAISAGELRAATQLAAHRLAKLFPRLPFWSPVWDDCPAIA